MRIDMKQENIFEQQDRTKRIAERTEIMESFRTELGKRLLNEVGIPLDKDTYTIAVFITDKYQEWYIPKLRDDGRWYRRPTKTVTAKEIAETIFGAPERGKNEQRSKFEKRAQEISSSLFTKHRLPVVSTLGGYCLVLTKEDEKECKEAMWLDIKRGITHIAKGRRYDVILQKIGGQLEINLEHEVAKAIQEQEVM
jgi:hypothetical protein